MPLVHLANFPRSHVLAEWQNDERRHWYEQLVGKGRMLIRYDGRGTGGFPTGRPSISRLRR